MPKEAFAALDFIKTSRCYPEDLKGLAKRFGIFGDKRRCTVSTCFQTTLMCIRINHIQFLFHLPGIKG